MSMNTPDIRIMATVHISPSNYSFRNGIYVPVSTNSSDVTISNEPSESLTMADVDRIWNRLRRIESNIPDGSSESTTWSRRMEYHSNMPSSESAWTGLRRMMMTDEHVSVGTEDRSPDDMVSSHIKVSADDLDEFFVMIDSLLEESDGT